MGLEPGGLPTPGTKCECTIQIKRIRQEAISRTESGFGVNAFIRLGQPGSSATGGTGGETESRQSRGASEHVIPQWACLYSRSQSSRSKNAFLGSDSNDSKSFLSASTCWP